MYKTVRVRNKDLVLVHFYSRKKGCKLIFPTKTRTFLALKLLTPQIGADILKTLHHYKPTKYIYLQKVDVCASYQLTQSNFLNCGSI